MYNQFFGLQTAPFGITPDTSFFYSGGEREALVSAIVYGICHGDGLVKVVGEVGSGKTMLSRMLARELPDHINLVFLLNPSLRANDLIFAIGHELGLQFDSTCSKSYALQEVQNKLLAMHGTQQRVVVFIDEAQRMPLETLEELRLLSNLETETDKLLQIVLFGQPELDEHLSHTSVRQIKERIIHSFYLQPFSRAEVGEYLSFRLHKAGYNGPPIFSASVLKLLTRYSSGLPRKLSILADKSLLAAFAAQSKTVKVCHVRLAAKDMCLAGSPSTRYLRSAIFTLLLVLVFYHFAKPDSAENISPPLTTAKPVDRQQIALHETAILVGGARDDQMAVDASRLGLSKQVVMSGARTGGPIPAPMLEALISKTQGWITVPNGSIYTIQILSADPGDDVFLTRFFRQIAEHIGLAELYVHTVVVDGKVTLSITLGGFSNFAEASAYLESLPTFIQRYQPFVQNMASFKRLD